jgi:hypothetical protein
VLVQYPYYHPEAVFGRLERRNVIATVAGEPALPVLMATEQVGIVGGGFTFLRTQGSDGTREDLQVEPGRDGGRDPADSGPERERLAALLDAELREHPPRPIEAAPVDPEQREALRALGYAE